MKSGEYHANAEASMLTASVVFSVAIIRDEEDGRGRSAGRMDTSVQCVESRDCREDKKTVSEVHGRERESSRTLKVRRGRA